jgi:hypothetical protein
MPSEKIIKKIKEVNKKINKLKRLKKKDLELFQLNTDDLELLHLEADLQSLQKDFKAFYANNSIFPSFSQDFFEVAREA